MPHDVNGTVLKEGDIVNLPCKVAAITGEGPDCNVNLEAIHATKSGYKPSIACNAAQTEKVKDSEAEG